MVSKKLQDKFYAALESLKDGKNDYILEALAAGAKATFEGLLTGQVSEDGTYIPSKDEVPRSASIGPDSCPKVLTKEDIQMLTHDPETEHEEDPEELNFDDNEAKRFPTYPGQFSEEEDPFYSMVAEAVTKLGNTINELKTTDNAPLVESIMEGFKTCFEAISKDSFRPALEPLKVTEWYISKYDQNWHRSASDSVSSMREVRRCILDAKENVEDKCGPDNVQVSKFYKGDIHGEPNENGDYFCVTITGVSPKGENVKRVVTVQRTSYEDPHKQFGQPEMHTVYNSDIGDYLTYDDNYKPNKPDSYYNHSPEDRQKLREYVDTHRYSKYRGMGMWDRGADYDEEAALNPKPQSDTDAEHAAEREMERRSEEAFMNSAYGAGNWSY